MDHTDQDFERGVARKLAGGVPIDAFVSGGIWLGGLRESRSHQPFVAVGPADWDGEDELTFFKSKAEVESFIRTLRAVSDVAFPQPDNNADG